MKPYVTEYGWEPHQVTTEDGYILTLFKLFKRDLQAPDNQSVLLQIGFGLDEVELFKFIDELPNPDGRKPIPFELADQGYDLWTNAFRGSRYN